MKERCVAGQDQDMVAAVQSVINTLLLRIKTMAGVDTAVSRCPPRVWDRLLLWFCEQ